MKPVQSNPSARSPPEETHSEPIPDKDEVAERMAGHAQTQTRPRYDRRDEQK